MSPWMREALRGGVDHEKVPMETKTYEVKAPWSHYRAVIQVSEVAHRRYIDESWRIR